MMKWFGLLVVGFVSWVLVRAFVPVVVLFLLGVSFLILYLYHDALPVLATWVIVLLWLSGRRARHGSQK